jgi:hypothetical protein
VCSTFLCSLHRPVVTRGTGRNHPLIKWNLRQKLHKAAGRINISVWDVEFLLQRFQWEVMEDPLKQLLDLVVSRS